MAASDHDLASLLSRAGFQRNPGASTAAVARIERAFRVTLPEDFRSLYSLADGASGKRIELLSLSRIEDYSEVFDTPFGYVPFTDSNDSNPYAICCDGPLRGIVVHVFHDSESKLICRGLQRFFELIADVEADEDPSEIEGDWAVARPDRTEDDALIGTALVRLAESLELGDDACTIALRYATQLFGAGCEGDLSRVLTLGDEYVREAVLERCAALGTPEARVLLRDDAEGYRRFLADFKQSAEAAGFSLEPVGRNGFRLQPGRINPNFSKLYSECRRPGAMAEFIERFRTQAGLPKRS